VNPRSQDAGRALLPYLLPACVGLIYLFHVQHLSFLGDDAYISFRYAQNLVEGYGLVFNPGERVEGYTNFSWVLLMAAAMKLGIPVESFSKLLGVLSGAGILFLVARLGARASGWRDPFCWLAPAALACNRSFCAWSTGGLETQFFSFLVLAALDRFIAERTRNDPAPWGSGLLFAAAALTRPEGILFAAIASTFLAADVLRSRRTLRDGMLWGLAFGLPVAMHFGWRLLYYGYPLPNTFYAKVSGAWFEQGWLYFRWFFQQHQLHWLLPLALFAWLRRRDFTTSLLLTTVIVFAGYVAYVGGDRFEFRFLVVILPMLFWLLQEGAREAVRWLGERELHTGWQLAAAIALSLIILAAAYRPHVLELRNQHGMTTVENIGRYAERRAEEGRFLRELVDEGYLQGDELVAVRGAGALPYFSRLPTFDIHGLSDIEVAHQELENRGVVGHEKVASKAMMRRRGVVMHDIARTLVLAPGSAAPDAAELRNRHGEPVHLVKARGRYLVFATTLSGEELHRRFARFEIVY